MDAFLANNISVIIPVYNAGSFVTGAVASALMQRETGEVILVEDGSTDNSGEICRQIEMNHDKVKLITHPGNINKGAGESRNLGIKMATRDYIAFLDADDYFLPERFRAERSIFKNRPEIDGVYGAMGFHYYSEEGKRKYREKGYNDLTTLSGKIPSNELCFSFIHLHPRFSGQFHLNTLTVKREVFAGRTPFFNSYTMHEDTAFLVQLSFNCRLEAGSITEPVAMYGVHDNNRIINNPENSGSRIKYWKYLYHWAASDKRARPLKKLLQALLMREKLLRSGRFNGVFRFIAYNLRNRLFLRKDIFFRPASLHVFGKYAGWYVINFKEQVQKKYFHDSNLPVADEMIKKAQLQ